jgi:shikimate dehydrogenase
MTADKGKVYGLIGYPVKHSLSAAMHNAAFAALGMDDCKYQLFEIEPDRLDYFLDSLDRNSICGLNVTVPYKEKILDFVNLDFESFYLREIGAVNTIVNKDGVRKGFNTDIPGFSKHLKEQIDPKDKSIAVIGAGGAARAVSYVLAKSDAREIAIFDIDNKKSENVARMIKRLFADFPISPVDNIEKLDIKNKDLLINATPVGLRQDDACLVTEELLHKDLFVYDLIYNPPQTKLLQLAAKVGAKTSNGLGMLLYQGMLSFEKWTGRQAPQEVMQKALEEALLKHNS